MSVFACAECSNRVDYYDEEPTGGVLCDYCACDKPTPKKIEIYLTHFTGTPAARCKKCDFVSVLWDCACDLEHDCRTNKRER